MGISRAKALGLVLLLFLWGVVGVRNAFAEQIQTRPHVFPLHLVSWSKDGPINPQISMQADFATYPNYPSYKQFLSAEADGSPEQAAARYLQTLAEAGDTSPDDIVNLGRRFYDEGAITLREEWVSKDFANDIKGDAESLKKNPDARFWHRYDVGPVSFIVLSYSKSNQIRPSAIILALHKVGDSYLILPSGILVSRTMQIVRLLIYLNDSHMLVKGEALKDVALPTYKYRYKMPNPVTGGSSPEHPLEILFNGVPSLILVNNSMVPANWAQAFVKRAKQLGLEQLYSSTRWTDQDAYIPPSALGFERLGASREQIHVVFTIDFGDQYLLFVRADEDKELRRVVVSKQSKQDGKLIGPENFPGNLLNLLDSPEFQSYLGDQVDRFTEANSPTRITPR